MRLDAELDMIEAMPQTEMEWENEETETYDLMSDIDEYLGADAMESDIETAYESFFSNSEEDYNGYNPSEIETEELAQAISDMFYSGGYHIEASADDWIEY